MKSDENNQSIIDEIIESLDINQNSKHNKKSIKKKKSVYVHSSKDIVDEEYEIIMDCNRSDYFVYYKKK